MNIDNQISRLVKKLPAGEGLPQMADALNKLMNSTVIEDLSPSAVLGASHDADEDEVDLR